MRPSHFCAKRAQTFRRSRPCDVQPLRDLEERHRPHIEETSYRMQKLPSAGYAACWLKCWPPSVTVGVRVVDEHEAPTEGRSRVHGADRACSESGARVLGGRAHRSLGQRDLSQGCGIDSTGTRLASIRRSSRYWHNSPHEKQRLAAEEQRGRGIGAAGATVSVHPCGLSPSCGARSPTRIATVEQLDRQWLPAALRALAQDEVGKKGNRISLLIETAHR